MYVWFMIIAVVLLGVGWAAYLLWDWKLRKEEAEHPKAVSQRLEKTRSEAVDWAKKMAAFKKPEYKPPEQKDTESKT